VLLQSNLTCVQFLPLLRQFKGRVVVVGSVNGSVGIPCMGAYCMSKFALEGLVDTLRVEVEPAGVAVSLVKPGRSSSVLISKAKISGQQIVCIHINIFIDIYLF
jgi:NAD(P)-dependent dehydrogenase (short-subunit alcohol dehydrogenase family)